MSSVKAERPGADATRRRARVVHRWWMPGLAIVALLGSIGVSMAAGSWESVGSRTIEVSQETGVADPADIRGWMTIADVSQNYRVPLDVIYAHFGVGAGVAPPETQLKDLEDVVEGFEVRTFREWVASMVP